MSTKTKTYTRYSNEPGYIPGTRQVAPGYVLNPRTHLPVKVGSPAHKLAVGGQTVVKQINKSHKPLVRSASRSVYTKPVSTVKPAVQPKEGHIISPKSGRSIKIGGKAYNDLMKDHAEAEATVGKRTSKRNLELETDYYNGKNMAGMYEEGNQRDMEDEDTTDEDEYTTDEDMKDEDMKDEGMTDEDADREAGSYQEGDEGNEERQWHDRRYIREDWPIRGRDYYGPRGYLY